MLVVHVSSSCQKRTFSSVTSIAHWIEAYLAASENVEMMKIVVSYMITRSICFHNGGEKLYSSNDKDNTPIW